MIEMKESAAMTEIHKIRDENSLRRLSQTADERTREAKETLDWFMQAIGKPIQIIKHEKTI
jgi:hypothetical protein